MSRLIPANKYQLPAEHAEHAEQGIKKSFGALFCVSFAPTERVKEEAGKAFLAPIRARGINLAGAIHFVPMSALNLAPLFQPAFNSNSSLLLRTAVAGVPRNCRSLCSAHDAMKRSKALLSLWVLAATLIWALIPAASAALTITVDYTYDSNSFFDTQAKRDAMQAAANRFAGVITSSLLAVPAAGTATGTDPGWRIGIIHPGTGANIQISTAVDAGSDPLVGAGAGAADVYGFGGLLADTWILYAGGRALGGPAGVGGTAPGANFTDTLDDLNGPMHRGLIPNTPASTVNDLPVWGGYASFEIAETWHFDLTTPAPNGSVDFYSIALHEVGHALGLNTEWNQWANHGNPFTGANALAAYNADNGTSLISLNLVSGTNPHWQDGTYDSVIFPLANPNYIGTVGAGNPQDLLMEPTANFTALVKRFELTNTDVGAL